MKKPSYVFDRDREWAGLTSFVADSSSNATLGVVSGRPRQGKSFLLQALTAQANGLYFAATEATEAESLRLFADALVRHTREPVEFPFRDWNDAIAELFRRHRGYPVPVVLDEFPFLVKSSPSLPSIIQRELGPGGSGRDSTARLLLCGSAMAIMGDLLAGSAPLRGRAGLELIVQPFGHLDAARFWDITDPRLAVMVNAIVGGTPAYRREFIRDDVPRDLDDFDDWTARTVLNPQTPLFRESRYLLAEEATVREPALYHSVLAAIATGKTTNGGIANFIGRSSSEITHPLNVLEDCHLVERRPDMFRRGRATYGIVEPLIAFYESIMRRRWSELEIGRGAQVWESVRPTFLSQVVGPRFEAICRTFALDRGSHFFGGTVAEVGSGAVNDPVSRTQIQIDVAALAPQETDQPRKVLSLGEVKWGEVIGPRHLQRLHTARDLVRRKGLDTSDTTLACFSAAGFTDELQTVSEKENVQLISLEQIYGE